MRIARGWVVAVLAGISGVGGSAGGQATAVETPAVAVASPIAEDFSNDREAVREVQRALADLGYDPGPADGAMGPRTRSAIRAFQSNRGIAADGIVSRALLTQLVEARAKVEPGSRTEGANLADDAARTTTQPTQQRSPDQVHACDLLAAARGDSHAVTEWISNEDIDGALALDACRRARAEFPTVARFAYQEARVLHKLERYSEALAILEQLASSNYPQAVSLLGAMHERGEGFPSKDVREAVEWYRRAADLGEPWAQVRLGRALAEGEGGLRQNDAEALRWFRSAAQAQEYGAAYIGYFYETGRGVPMDTAEALRWYRQAAEGGDKWALEQVERFDSAAAREIRETLRQREETKRAEIAARKREAEALLAAEAQELPQLTELQPPRLGLDEAIEDLGWMLAEKIDADVLEVARTLREAQDEARATDMDFRPLVAAAAEDVPPSEDRISGAGVASLWWRLAAASTGRGGLAAGQRTLAAPVDTAQAQLVIEVADRYERPADRDSALQLYLLGFRDLDSPIGLPSWVAESPLLSVHAAAQHLRERLEMLQEEVAEEHLSAEVELDPLRERLQAVTEAIAASRSGVVEMASIGDPPWERQLGAIGGLAALRGKLTSHPTTEGPVLVAPDLSVTPGEGFQIASLSLACRLEDGTELGQAAQQFPLPVGAALPELSDIRQADAQDLRRELAEAMLVALPVELANLWWLTEDTIGEVRKAVDRTEPNSWSPHFAVAGAATEPVATADTEPGTVVARSEPEATAVEPAAGPGQAHRMAKVELRDGSTVTAQLVAGTLTFKLAFGELPIPLDDLADLSEGQLRLHDGTLLRGELVGGEVVISTGVGNQALAAPDIVSIAFVEEGTTKR